MRLIDADRLKENMRVVRMCTTNRQMPDLDKAMRMVDRAPTVTRLCVCGTCGEWSYESHRSNEYMHCKHDSYWQDSVCPHDPCHFTPSRWTPYWDDDAPR